MREGAPPEFQQASVEKISSRETKRIVPLGEKSPRRLMLALDAMLKPAINKISLKGQENLRQIDRNRPLIIVTTHISDLDVPIVARSLGDMFDIAISNQSVHHSFFGGEKMTNIGLRLAGKDNFLPITYSFKEGEEKVHSEELGGDDKKSSFNPEDFINMVSTVTEKGKAIIVAAHNPAKDWRLPERGGVGGVYLSGLLEKAVLLPVAVNIKTATPVGMGDDRTRVLKERPDAEVTIGEPFELPATDGVQDLASLMERRKAGQQRIPDDRHKIRGAINNLREQSDIVMGRLASLLPENKRNSLILHSNIAE